MTPVIATAAASDYSGAMPSNAPELATLLAEHRELQSRIDGLLTSPREALAAGEALLAFAAREQEAFSSLAPLLDPAVYADLNAEHQQIADDLELLAWLARTAPDSPDLTVLTTSLVRRMRGHMTRDARLLLRAATLGQGK